MRMALSSAPPAQYLLHRLKGCLAGSKPPRKNAALTDLVRIPLASV